MKIYNEKSISVLEGLEGVRHRPSMYVGDVSSGDGIYRCVKEALDNGYDECANGYSKQMGFINTGISFVVWDCGRGIPVGIHPKFKKEKLSTLEVVMTKLHAGGKMDTSNYANSVGRNGVGISVTNALSSLFKVTTYRDKKWWTQEYEQGKAKSKVVMCKNPSKRLGIKITQGTVLEFTPDYSVFAKNAKLDDSLICNWLKFSQYLVKGVDFVYINKQKNIERHFSNIKGLQGYLERICKKLEFDNLTSDYIFNNENIDIALRWVKKDDYDIYSYVNGSPTEDGGTHVKGLCKLIGDTISDYGNSRDKFKSEDVLEGLVAIINLKIDEPLFDSQTKTRLTNKDVVDLVYEILEDSMSKWASKNKKAIKEIIQRANDIRGAKTAFEQTRKAALAVKGPRGKTNLPPAKKFSVSTTKNANERELFCVEGDSAAGTAKAAKDHRFQEVLGLRGKILNIGKTSNKAKLFESEEVLNIMKAIGYNPDSKELIFRVGKVILLSDNNPDGRHIDCLVSTLLQTICPELIEKGMLYKVDAPLFIGRTETKEYYGANINELKKQYKGKFKSITRVKGWGESLKFNTYINTDLGLLTYREYAKLKGFPLTGSFYVNSNCMISNACSMKNVEYVKYVKNSTVQIKNSLGIVLEGSPKHKNLVIRDGNLLEVSLKDVQLGDYTLVSRGLQNWGKKHIKPELARFCGHIIADGNWRGTNFSIVDSKDSPYNKDLEQSLKDNNVKYTKFRFNNSDYISSSTYFRNKIYNHAMLDFSKKLKDVNMYGNSYTKEVPLLIRMGDRRTVCEFLKTYIGRDGGIIYLTKNSYEIELTSVSKKLIYQVQQLLLNLGIVSSVIRINSGSFKPENLIYKLRIVGVKNLRLYKKYIGFLDKKQNKRLNKVCNQKYNANIDCLFGIKDRLKRLMDKHRIRKFQPYFNIDGKVTKLIMPRMTSAKDFTWEEFNTYVVPYIDNIRLLDKEFADLLTYLARNNFYFSPVVDIKTKDKKVKLFDFGFEETGNNECHLFSANSILTHNCSPTLLKKVAFDPKTRSLLKIKQVKGKELKEAMLLMGDDAEIRRKLLSSYGD